MEQTASPGTAPAAKFEGGLLRDIQSWKCVEFDPLKHRAPISLYCRPTAGDVARVVGAWLFGWGVPQRGLPGRSK